MLSEGVTTELASGLPAWTTVAVPPVPWLALSLAVLPAVSLATPLATPLAAGFAGADAAVALGIEAAVAPDAPRPRQTPVPYAPAMASAAITIAPPPPRAANCMRLRRAATRAAARHCKQTVVPGRRS